MNGEEEDLADSVGAAADVDRDPDPILDLAIEYAIKRTYPEFCNRGYIMTIFALLIIHWGHRQIGNGKLQVCYDKKDTFTMSHVFSK